MYIYHYHTTSLLLGVLAPVILFVMFAKMTEIQKANRVEKSGHLFKVVIEIVVVFLGLTSILASLPIFFIGLFGFLFPGKSLTWLVSFMMPFITIVLVNKGFRLIGKSDKGRGLVFVISSVILNIMWWFSWVRCGSSFIH